MAALILTVGLGLTPWITRIIRTEPAFVADVRWAWVFTVLSLGLLIFMPFRAMFDAEQKGFIYNLLCSFQALAIVAMSLVFAYAGWGVKGQSLAVFLGTAMAMLILTTLAVRHRPEVLGGLREPPDPEASSALRRLSGPNLLMNLASRISLMTDGLVVLLILGEKAVTVLYLTQRLIIMVQAQLQGVGGSAWAGLADLHARGERDTFNRRLVELTRLVAILGVAALGPIIAFNGRFLALWVGTSRNGGDLMALAAGVNALMLATLALWGWCLTGTGHAPQLVRPSLASAAINLSASVGLTYALGVAGPLLGTTTAFLAVNLWYLPVLLHKYFGTSLRDLFRAVIVPLAFGIPATFLLWLLVRSSPPPRWIPLALEMGGSALLYLSFAARFLLAPEDRLIWRRRLSGAIPRFRVRALDT